MTATIALARAPKQLDIIYDTALRAQHVTPGELSTARPVKTPGELSTKPKVETPGELSTAMGRIERRRKEIRVTIAALCAAAGIHNDTYEDARAGRSKVRPATVARLEQALDRFAVGYAEKERRTIGEAYLRELIIDIAKRLGIDPEAALAQDFTSENTNDVIFMQNCHVRRCAIYLMVEGMGFGKAAVARIVGVSRQAVHKMGFAIEAKRQRDASLDEMLGDMMLRVKGKRL